MADESRIMDALLDCLLRWEAQRERGERVSIEELSPQFRDLLTALSRSDVSKQAVAERTTSHHGTTPGDVAPPRSASSGAAQAWDLGMTAADPHVTKPPIGSLAALDSAFNGPEDEADFATRTSCTIPGYEILGELGQGGMGRVYRGRDQQLGREVAVKVLLDEHAGSVELLQRFLREARINSQLQHPGIAPVHELGEFADGRPYFTMKVVKGQTLAELLRKRAHPEEDRGKHLKVFEQVCQTLAYAHAHCVIHRDLKPHNIMVGAFGETQVMDWGLAKLLKRPGGDQEATAADRDAPTRINPSVETDGDLSDLKTGIVGTPAYAAPEQRLGRHDLLDARCDVFGLGAILCEILCCQPPYSRLRWKARRQDLADELASTHARLESCGADADLVRLAQRCLALDPDDRPRDAGELAAAMTAYLESVEERLRQAERDRAAAEVRAKEERKRRSLAVALAAAVLIVGGLAGGGALWLQSQRGETERSVRLALDRATELRAAAEGMPSSTAREVAAALVAWRQTQAAIERAEDRLEIGLADDELHRSVADARREVDAAVRQLLQEENLIRGLDAARLARMTWVQSSPTTRAGAVQPGEGATRGAFDNAGSSSLYAAAFAEYGVGVETDKLDQLAIQICRQRPAVREALVAGLDHWALVQALLYDDADSGDPPVAALVQLANDCDADEQRRRIRVVGWAREAADLQAMAQDVEQLEHSAAQLETLAVFLRSNGLRDDAVDVLRLARRKHPDDFWIHYELGSLLGFSNPSPAELEEAIGCLWSAIALSPLAAPAHNDLGLALSNKGDRRAAMAAYRRALELNDQLVEAHNNLGIELRELGDLDGAKAAFHKALAINPHSASAHSNLGGALADAGDQPGAIAAFHAALEIDPEFADARFSLGNRLADAGELAAAITEYRKAIDINPQFAEAHLNLGLALEAQQDLPAAIAQYRKAIEARPMYAAAHNNLGVALDALGDLAAAAAAYQKAIEIDAGFAAAYTNLGVVLGKNNDYAGAILKHRQAIAIDPRFAEAHHNLGEALLATNALKEAVHVLRRAVALAPRDAESRVSLGAALARSGEPGQAVAEYRQAIELRPGWAMAHANLGGALSETNDADGALAALRRAIELDPRNFDAHYNLGAVLINGNDLAGGIGALRRAIELDPRAAAAHESLGVALARSGDFTAAAASLERCLELLPESDPWRPAAVAKLQEVRKLVTSEARLPEILADPAAIRDVEERAHFADICRLRRHYVAGLRLFEGVLAEQMDQPFDLVRERRYLAACCAALAGTARGVDAGNLTDEERRKLRFQAIEWLQADAATWSKRLENGTSEDCQLVARTLTYWRRDPDLSPIRDADQLARLPADEQQAAGRLWEDVRS